MDSTHYRSLEHMYLASKINTMIYDTTTVHIGEGAAEIGLTLSEKYFHALDAMHGSVYFKLLDDACFFAVNSLVSDVFVLTASFEIQLLRPEHSGKIIAHGNVIERGDRKFKASAVLTNQHDKELARGTGIFVKSKTPLSPEIGYQ